VNSSSFDIVSIGDCVIDAFLQIHEASIHCHVEEKNRELCFRFGDKIPVEDCQFLLGGNGASTAVGFSRLGFTSSIIAEIGNDEFSSKIIHTLKNEQVDTSFLVHSQSPSTFSVIINFQKERTIFSRHINRNHEFDFDLLQTQWLYLTSLGEEWKKAYDKAVEFVQNSNIKLAFSPGSHQLEGDVRSLQPILKHTDILFVNKEEGVRISNFKFLISNDWEDNKKSMRELLVEVQTLGPKIVVITDGLKGSFVYDELGKAYYCSIANGPIIERTGAGDGYASGFLSAVILGKPLEEAMKWGTINAWSVVQKTGAQGGLLKREEIEEKVIEHPEMETVILD